MFSSARSIGKRRFNRIINHQFSAPTKGKYELNSPQKITKCDSDSTSPSPLRHLTPSKNKIKRTSSKLWEGAHQARQGQTYLVSSCTYAEKKESVERIGSNNGSKTKTPKTLYSGKAKKFDICPQFSLKINNDVSLSGIIMGFDEEYNSLSQISEHLNDSSLEIKTCELQLNCAKSMTSNDNK